MTNSFSVVIPLYNKEKHIQRAIRSVLAQTCQDFELIIVDDGSTDGSFEVASEIQDARIRIVRQENKGVSAARNRGVTEAKYDWVAFLDADDEWLPEFLMNIEKIMNTYSKCGVYATFYTIVDINCEEISPKPAYAPGEQVVIDDLIKDFRLTYPFNSSSVVVSKEIITKIGGFPVNINEGEDVITWLKLWLVTPVAYFNWPLSIYHQDADNRSFEYYKMRTGEYEPAKFLLRLIKERRIPVKFHSSAIEYIAKHQIVSAKRSIRTRHSLQAIKYLWTCRQTKEQKRTWRRLLTYSFLSLCVPSLSNRV